MGRDVRSFPVSGAVGIIIVTAKVRHSPSVSAALLKSWIATDKDCTVYCAHCTYVESWIAADKYCTVYCAHCICVTGLGEACSHIAALLFAVETTTRFLEETSCASVPCQWKELSLRNAQYSRIVY